MNGKGSRPRPLAVRPQEYADRWAQTFTNTSHERTQQTGANSSCDITTATPEALQADAAGG